MEDFCSFNFCEFPDNKLLSLIDYLGHSELLKKSEVEKKFNSKNICIEIRWCWYDELIITPKHIWFSPDPQPRKEIFNYCDYYKMKKIFE